MSVTSVAFAAGPPTAVLLSGAAVPFARLDDTTLQVSLPDLPGSHTVSVVAPTVLPGSVAVQLRGFLDRLEGPPVSGRTEPGLDPRHVFGNGPTSLRRWNVATNKTLDFDDSVHAVACTSGVGPGPGPGELVLRGACGAAQWAVWRTEPFALRGDTAEATTDRFVAVLAPGRWVIARETDFLAVACDATACETQSIAASGGLDVVRSSRGDRATLVQRATGESANPGVPVVDVEQGALAFRATALRSAQGAAFSRGGDTLYVAGDSAGMTRLVAVRASDGVTLGSRDLAFAPCAVGLDPEQPWLYVAGAGRLQVFDQRTLLPITTLHVTGAPAFGAQFCRILPNPIGRMVNVAETWAGEFQPDVLGQLYRFETP